LYPAWGVPESRLLEDLGRLTHKDESLKLI
jgi:hypothetical protein